MGFVTQMVSDLSGTVGPESNFTTIIVREHPEVDEPKALDVLPDEIKGLKGAGQFVVLELKTNGDTKQVVVSLDEFNKLAPNMSEIVKAARGTRGRRPGSTNGR
jgi:hypothetical protein